MAAGHDSHMRAEWQLAERVVCPSHKEMLRDHCPDCGSYLRISFRMRDDRLLPFCQKCDGLLPGRGGEAAVRSAVEFVIAVLSLQRRAGRIVRGDADLLAPLAQAICTLWAPLDRVDAARPVLALWFDQPGWHCPFEARAVVGTPAPLRCADVGCAAGPVRSCACFRRHDAGGGLQIVQARRANAISEPGAGVRDQQRSDPC